MNNKWMKLVPLLAAGLLLLSGCYIAPDDVSTTGAVNTGNSLPFQTLVPTATVVTTPDTVPIGTQNVFGDNHLSTVGAHATPSPTWADWETVPTDDEARTTSGMPTAYNGTIYYETPTPGPWDEATAPPAVETTRGISVITAAPATPSPTPPSLQRGFTASDEVRALQKRLKQLGYYSGNVDGDFGAATEKAVKAFQKANGLTADGKAGKQTLEKLNSSSAITAKQANATAAPKVTAKPTARVTATPRPTATPNLSRDYYLRLGSRGDKVTTLQNRLISLGWLGGKATGTFDEATEYAVRAFQKKTKGLYDDGVAGPDTLRALYSDGAAKASSMVSSTTWKTLELGNEDSEVRALQNRLKKLGYLSGSVDGQFGVATQAAVIAFQQNNGLTADGKAGAETLNRLYSEDAVKSGGGAANLGTQSKSGSSNSGGRDTSGIASTGYVTLETGSSGDAVRTLQKRLKELKYYSGSVDGNYGESTAAAVMAFQLKNNLTVDGKAGPATQRVLYGSSGAIAYSALRMGDSGSAVKNLQYTLYELGYYDGSINGEYGQTTSDAVRAFQIQNKLTPVDGVAGSDTLARLYSSDAISATAANVDYGTVRPGDRGDDVVQVQDCLVQMGYLDQITGVYDDATVAAVKAFQRENGITADGVAGPKTLVILFGY